MRPFLERFYSSVFSEVGYPFDSAALDKPLLLEALHEVDGELFSELIRSTGQETNLGFAEATVTLKSDVEFYLFPAGFHRFLGMVRVDEEGHLLGQLRTRSYHQVSTPSRQIHILSGNRGFRIDPTLNLDADENWTLHYLRRPGLLHYAKAESHTSSSLVAGTPGTDAGEVVLQDDYYNGLMLRIYAADTGAPVDREIKTFKVVGGKGTFFRHSLGQDVTGDVWYEICPCLPYPLDSILPLDVALSFLPRREKVEKANELLKLRIKKWQAAVNWVTDHTSDRGPSRTHIHTQKDRMPIGEAIY